MENTFKGVTEPYPALEIAKCIIKIANDQIVDEDPETGRKISEGVTNMKLQKLLYFAQAAHLAVYGEPLFNDEIQAWKFGPVVPNVYRFYKVKGDQLLRNEDDFYCDPQLEGFLKDVWKIFGKYSAYELANISHKHDPYKDVYDPEERGTVINQGTMRDYYKKMFQVTK
jgi:uncharacterized phage-associated protein